MGKFTQKYLITADNMDINYRLRPISCIMFFQDSFARFLTTKNLAAFDIEAENLIWVITGFNIDFCSDLPFWSEEIEVEIWVSESGKLKMYTDFELKHNGKVFAKGNACWLIINTQTRRPIIMDKYTGNIEPVNELVLDEHKRPDWNEVTDFVTKIEHKITISDIDFNNHTNNKSYLNIAESAADDNFKSSHNLKELSVRFFKESFLGDVLTCSAYKTSTENQFIHKIENSGEPVCYISTTWEEKSAQNSIKDFDLGIRSKIVC